MHLIFQLKTRHLAIILCAAAYSELSILHFFLLRPWELHVLLFSEPDAESGHFLLGWKHLLNTFGIYDPDLSTVQLASEQHYNRTDTTAAD